MGSLGFGCATRRSSASAWSSRSAVPAPPPWNRATPPSPRRSGRSTGTARDDRLQVRRHRVLVGVLEQPRRPDQQDEDFREVLRDARRRAAIGVDQLLGECRKLGQRGGMAGMRQQHAAPDEPGQRAQPRQPLRRQRPGAAQVALVRGEAAPEPVGAAPVEAFGEEPGVDRPALGAAAGDLGLPAGAAAAAEPADPVLHPALRHQPRRPIAEGREIVEPEAGLPLGFEPGVGQRHHPDRALADRHLVVRAPAIAVDQCVPAPGVAEQHRLGQRRRDLRAAAEPRPVRPEPVAPGARRPGETLADEPSASSRTGTWHRAGDH